ncbi:MAG TPA: hypothetical protein VGF60_22930 [Xanthobacteraceae bacterium]|jgi:hypothetical protein
MRYMLQPGILLALMLASPAAVAQGTQNVQPLPLPAPQLSPQTSALNCMSTCDAQAMSCQNACVPIGPIAVPNPAGSASCNLSCTTQQLVCKQGCTRQ